MRKYWELMRFHKPVGIFLLLWPTLWALWIAAGGHPSFKNLFIFISGTIVMRAAGCVINDIADREFDLHVARTSHRPITSGKITTPHAVIVLLLLCLVAFALVLLTNALTILLSIFAVGVAMIYPFMKRYTHWPQLVLGVAFSFSIPMAFAAETGAVPMIAVLLMVANIAWTIAYDTEYAMVDRADDIKIGIKSTAILFGRYDQLLIGLFQLIAIILLCLIGVLKQFSLMYFGVLGVSVGLFCYQQYLMRQAQYFRAFLNNQWVGAVVLAGIMYAFM